MTLALPQCLERDDFGGGEWALLTRELPAAANAKRLVMPEKPVSYYYIEQYREQKIC